MREMIDCLHEFRDLDELMAFLSAAGWGGVDSGGQATILPPHGCGFLETKPILSITYEGEGEEQIANIVPVNGGAWAWLSVPVADLEELANVSGLVSFVFCAQRGTNEVDALGDLYSLDDLKGWLKARQWSGMVIDFPSLKLGGAS